jgi:cobalt-zinc-cadmium efflux system protein
MGDDGGSNASRTAVRVLWVVLLCDIGVTAAEFVGAYLSRSLALWSNFLTGLYDAVLLGLNIFGMRHEVNGHRRRARRVARLSDSLLAMGYTFVLALAADRLLGSDTHTTVNGTIVMWVASFAAAINFGGAIICPKGFLNCQSARLKLLAGGLVAAMTIGDGLWIQHYGSTWIDPAVTLLIGMFVISAAIYRVWRC